jgi:hypothetical protein
MGLIASRHEVTDYRDFPGADLFGTSLKNTIIEEDYYDHPYPKFSILLHKVTSCSNPNGTVISREEEWWDYDETSRAKLGYSKDVYAWGFIPGVTNQPDLVLVEKERTVYTVKDYFIIGGADSGHVTTRAGYVLYDKHPTARTLSAAQQAVLTGRGFKASSVLVNGEIIDSGKKYAQALSEQRVVYDPNAPQVCKWKDPTEIEIVDVQEDTEKIVTTTIKKDCLHEAPPKIDRKETHKKGLQGSLPITLDPPKIKAASAGAKGVYIDIKGGGGSYVSYLGSGLIPTPFTQPVSPDSYIIFRKTTAQPGGPATSTDPFGLWLSAPASVPQGIARVTQNAAVKDYAGNVVDPHPGETSYTVPENPTPPTPDTWHQAGVVKNAVQEPRLPGAATFYDLAVDNGFSYEYFAVAVVGSAQSPDSNHETVTYSGPQSTSSGAQVVLKPKIAPGKGGPIDGALTIEVTGPDRAGVGECYGRTRSYDPVWASFSSEQAALDFGTNVGQRQFAKTSPGPEIKVTPSAVMFELERGMLTAIPALTWETWGNQLHLSSQLRSRAYYLNGFGWTVAMDQNGFITSQAGDLTLEEL